VTLGALVGILPDEDIDLLATKLLTDEPRRAARILACESCEETG
jgi:hypothetical protein